MRKDMKHVIIDRPRTGGNGGNSDEPKGNKRKQQKIEDLPVFESSARKRRYGYVCKRLSDNLSPLKRWLGSQVGRPWNDIYSEICENLRKDSVIQRHVHTHINQMVVTVVQIINDEVCNTRGETLSSGRYYDCFYVDQNGILQELKYERRRWNKKTYNWFPGKDENHQLHCIKGVWYEVELRPYPKNDCPHVWTGYRDVVLDKSTNDDKRRMNRTECKNLYGREVYGYKKRQLSKKECRKLHQEHPEAVEIRNATAKI